MSELKKQLKALKHGEVNPREEWLKKNRGFLLAQIKNTIPAEREAAWEKIWLGLSVFMPRKFVFNVVRPLSVLLVVAVIGMSGWIATVDAAYEALPGDWLYPAKRAVEKTQVVAASLVGAKSTETKLHSEFAKRRATEIKKVVQSDDPEKGTRATATVNDLKTEISNVNSNLEEIKSGNQDGGEAAREVQKNTEQIKNVLSEVKADLSLATSTADKTLTKEIGEARNMAKDTGVKAVEVMVSKHLEGDKTVSSDEVKEAIGKAVQSAVNDAAASKQNAEGVKLMVDAINSEVGGSTLAAVSATSTTSTPNMSQRITTAATQAQQATASTTAAVTDIDRKAGEVKDLLASGNLTQAMDMVKEVSATTKAVEQVSDQALSAAQAILPAPVVSAVKEGISNVLSSPSGLGVTVVSSSVENLKVIVTTTPQVVEPNKLPVSVIVTTTPKILPATTTAK